MNSVWYGIAIVAIFIVIHWYVTNDKLPNGETKGLLAMQPPNQGPAIVRRRKRARFSLKNTP